MINFKPVHTMNFVEVMHKQPVKMPAKFHMFLATWEILKKCHGFGLLGSALYVWFDAGMPKPRSEGAR